MAAEQAREFLLFTSARACMVVAVVVAATSGRERRGQKKHVKRERGQKSDVAVPGQQSSGQNRSTESKPGGGLILEPDG